MLGSVGRRLSLVAGCCLAMMFPAGAAAPAGSAARAGLRRDVRLPSLVDRVRQRRARAARERERRVHGRVQREPAGHQRRQAGAGRSRPVQLDDRPDAADRAAARRVRAVARLRWRLHGRARVGGRQLRLAAVRRARRGAVRGASADGQRPARPDARREPGPPDHGAVARRLPDPGRAVPLAPRSARDAGRRRAARARRDDGSRRPLRPPSADRVDEDVPRSEPGLLHEPRAQRSHLGPARVQAVAGRGDRVGRRHPARRDVHDRDALVPLSGRAARPAADPLPGGAGAGLLRAGSTNLPVAPPVAPLYFGATRPQPGSGPIGPACQDGVTDVHAELAHAD